METQSVNSIEIQTGVAALPTLAAIREWIVNYLAELLQVAPAKVDLRTPFDRFGLDSSAVVSLVGDLEAWLGLELSPVLLFDYPTIEALADHLAEEVKTPA